MNSHATNREEYLDNDDVTIDTLTGLFNRNKLFTDLKNKKHCILAIINIDSFSDINNAHGEFIGNIILKEVAKRLEEYKQRATVYRCNGDEYAIILPYEYETDKIVYSKIEEVLTFITKEKLLKDNIMDEIHLGFTIGVAYGLRDLYVNANVAFQIAKESHKSIIIYHDKYINHKINSNNQNKENQKAKEAIKKGKIVSYYQPIICNQEKKIVKYEALARLKYDNKIIYPNEFIEAAKRAKVYTDITISMVRKVFEDFKDREEKVSINIATEDIFNEEIVKRIEAELRGYSNAEKVVFEITESGKIQCYETLNKFIYKMTLLGAEISIDDFGTEYSNLTHLSKLEVNYLKIDGQFIKNCNNNSKDLKILESIALLAQKLNIKTVAEYVENEETLEIVTNLGIDYSQGYLFGKAEPIEFLGEMNE